MPPVVISQQTLDDNRKSRQDHDLQFTVLSGNGGDVGAASGCRWVISEEIRQVHRDVTD